MASQTILWIALPNGFTQGTKPRARLSVFVSPRLLPDEDSHLSAFDFSDWPARLNSDGVEFEIGFDGSTAKAQVMSRAVSKLWQGLFHDGIPVRRNESRSLSTVFGSYSAAKIHDHLKTGYQEICATAPLDLPTPEVLTKAFSSLHESFVPIPEGSVDVASLSESAQRVAITRDLFRLDARETIGASGDRLVDLAVRAADRARREKPVAEFVSIVPEGSGAANDFAQFAVFHQQPRGTKAAPERSPRESDHDFHQLLSKLGDYPGLLRLLGLVIELEIDVDNIPETAPGAHGLLRLIPKFPTANPNVSSQPITPATAYVFQRNTRFSAAPGSTDRGAEEIIEGLVNFRRAVAPDSSDSQFQIIQTDLDSAGLQTIELLNKATFALTSRSGVQNSRSDQAPSPLRSNGISIVRQGTARMLSDAIQTGISKLTRILAGEVVPLFAEDLVRGCRVDVWDDVSNRWHSLHQRKGKYVFLRLDQKEEIIDESSIQPGIVQPAEEEPGAGSSRADPAAANYVSESLFLWQGWSLAAKRPVREMTQPESPSPPSGSSPAVSADVAQDLETNFEPVERSLPRLRFGMRYRFRARSVDLAGNSLSIANADALLARFESDGREPPVLPLVGSAPANNGDPRPTSSEAGFPFLRFEAIASPVVVPRASRQPGDSVEHIVLRSNPDRTPEEFAVSHPALRLAAERHIAPPKTSQMMAEMFGWFDASIGTGRDFKRTFALANRESGSLGSDETTVHPEAMLAVPYLPDPMAAGAAFRGLPGVPDGMLGRVRDGRLEFSPLPFTTDRAKEVSSLVIVDFGPESAWPDLRPFRLRLSEGEGQPAWEESERVLTVFLQKGGTKTVKMSCYLRDDALRNLGIWKWMIEWIEKQALSPEAARARLEEFRQLSLLGLWWMQTPSREFRLTHAVPRPVEAPKNLSLQTIKLGGSTFAYLGGNVAVHAASTGRVELIASWTEMMDEPTEPRQPNPIRRNAQVFAAPFYLPTDPGPPRSRRETDSIPPAKFEPASGTLEFLAPDFEEIDRHWRAALGKLSQAKAAAMRAVNGLPEPNPPLVAFVKQIDDPLRRLVDGNPLLIRWADVITAAADIDALITQTIEDPDDSVNVPADVAGQIGRISLALSQVSEAAASALQTLGRFEGRHQFGDTKHRRVQYCAVATTRFAECFAIETRARSDKFTRESETVTVDILSSAPPAPPIVEYIVPAFTWTRNSQTEAPQRQSTRKGGALRIYLARPWFSSGEGERLAVLLGDSASIARMKPFVTLWGRDPLWRTSSPTPQMPTAENFRNAEIIPNGVAYGIDFDDQGRCFCDIELDPGDSYFPFVRLALARFQPHSIPGLEISSPVVSDFVQLAPDRAVTVTNRAGDVFEVTVSGRTHASPTDPNNPASATGTRMRVTMQERMPGATDDVGWLALHSITETLFSAAGGTIKIVPEIAIAMGEVLWKGTVTLFAERKQGQFRVCLQELETYRSLDPESAAIQLTDRVVFAETIEL